MKTSLKTKVAFVSALFVAVLSSSAQQFAIVSFTVDGGGGASSNAQYVLSGTIGQPDAGVMSGGNFVVEGGFWNGAPAIQLVTGPLLSISRAGSSVLLSWNPSTPGFVLQQSSLLTTSSWSAAPSGATNNVMIPANAAARFYRLFKP